MRKSHFALFAAGTINIFAAGSLKLLENTPTYSPNKRKRHNHPLFVCSINAVKVLGGVGTAAALPLTTRLDAFTSLQEGSDEKNHEPTIF